MYQQNGTVYSKTARSPEPVVKHDPYTLEALTAWIETKPADEVYCYLNSGQCLLGQYAQFIGEQRTNGTSAWRSMCYKFADRYDYPRRFKKGINEGAVAEPFGIAVSMPHTFGAALSRARAIQAALAK